jgi:hypothetical protein
MKEPSKADKENHHDSCQINKFKWKKLFINRATKKISYGKKMDHSRPAFEE